ncbi:MAG: DUF817 domain-containing protein, partial [Gammaproteobacteria bacterium]|nr:DUF817 domain-containing protein [Gammaproteobacteria bacterium]
RTFIREFWIFGLKQAWACIFGGALLGVMIITQFWYPFEDIYRYDFLFIAAVLIQVLLLAFKLETWREALVILIFHVVATAMEIFKTHPAIGSWSYPGQFEIGILSVPLFAGFMYSAVGSYIARAWRGFEFRYSTYPPTWQPVLLVTLIYINFFTHHFLPDIRWLLLAASFWIYKDVWIHFKVDVEYRRMPLLLGFFLVSLFIWIAENIATYTRVWIYPTQSAEWHMVPFSKLIAWFLLMMLSFVLVSLVNRPQLTRD